MADQKKLRPRQVAAYQSLRAVMVDEAATCGAQIGVNLLLPDGTVGTLAQLSKLFGSTATAGTGTITTTDDLEEGQWNLWFTNRRAQDAVGGILADSANVTLAYVGGTSITADLTALTDSGAGALLATTFDAKGRKTGSRAATITGTAGRITVANGDAAAGLPTIDLATVVDAGGGTLQRTVFDVYGRKTGTSAATTTDLAEGTNLYFTDTRVRATALTGLSTATATPVTAADSVLVGVGKLQGQASAATTAIAGKEPSITPGTTVQYWRGDKTWRDFATDVRAAVLTGLSTATSAIITATDTVLGALGKLQAQITTNLAALTGHTSNTSNPHGVTKAQVGLGNVDNTSDADKPVSTAQAAADALRVLKTGDTMSGNLATTGVFGSGGSSFAGDALFAGSQAGMWAQSSTAAARLVCLSSASNVQFIGARSGGTIGAPTATPTTVGLLEFDASSYTGSGWVYPGTAAWVTTEAHSPTARGTRYEISTTPVGTTTLLKRLHVDRVGTGAIGPGTDNTQDLGEASLRWAVVRAGTGTINTSDAREKTEVVPLTADELAAAADLARATGTYQWLSSVQAKGADARHHAGLTVQQAIAIMQSHGLDPMRYGFICYDKWPETPEVVETWPAQDAVLDEAGNVVSPAVESGSRVTQTYMPAGDRYSFRHDELLLFIARGLDARLAALEAKTAHDMKKPGTWPGVFLGA